LVLFLFGAPLVIAERATGSAQSASRIPLSSSAKAETQYAAAVKYIAGFPVYWIARSRLRQPPSSEGGLRASRGYDEAHALQRSPKL